MTAVICKEVRVLVFFCQCMRCCVNGVCVCACVLVCVCVRVYACQQVLHVHDSCSSSLDLSDRCQIRTLSE